VNLAVVCCFWLDPARRRDYQFGPEHVRIWDRMVARHLTIPHRRVCVTHRPDLIDFMDTVPLDDRKHVPGTVFARLMLRRPDIGDVLQAERILSLDIDCVVTGSLDPLVERTEDAVFWRNPNWPAPKRAFYQTSIQLFDAGARSELWTDFDPQETPKWVNRRFGGAEQAWVSERLPWNLPHWTDADGVYGFKRLGGAGIDVELPENARIVFTPGNREPGQLKAIPWIEEHYR
jgi:hypothetical protein